MIRVLSAILLLAMIVTASCMKSNINACEDNSFTHNFITSTTNDSGEFIEVDFEICILNQYAHQQLEGIDSNVGLFYREDNVGTINYDMGFLAGEYVQEDTPGAIEDNAVDTNFRYLKSDSSLIITFPELSANFYLDDLTFESDVLSMMRTVDIK